MSTKPEIFKDGFRIVCKHPGKTAGSPPNIRIFNTTRIGFVFPGLDHPGYVCLLAMEEKNNIHGRNPLVLLTERQETEREDFFNHMVGMAKAWFVEWLLSEIGPDNAVFENAFYRYCSERNITNLRLFDTSAFPDLERGIAMIKDWRRKKALFVAKESILGKQIAALTADALKDPEKIYAIQALANVLVSFEMYPWQKPKKYMDPYYGRRSGYGS